MATKNSRATETPASASQRPRPARTLDRAFAVLESFGPEHSSLTLGEVASRARLPVSTTHRFLQDLVTLGYMRQSEGKRYSLSVRALGLTQGFLNCPSVPGTFRLLQSLAASTGVGWALLVPDGFDMVIVAFGFANRVEPDTVPVGVRLPMHKTAFGLAVAAFLEPAEQERLLRMGEGQRDFNPQEVRRQIAETACRGTAILPTERAVAIAAPVLDHHHRPIAAIGATGSIKRFSIDRMTRDFNEYVRRVAADVSASQGWFEI